MNRIKLSTCNTLVLLLTATPVTHVLSDVEASRYFEYKNNVAQQISMVLFKKFVDLVS